MKSEIPSPKSDLALRVRRERGLEIRNPKIRSPRPHAESNKSERSPSPASEMGAAIKARGTPIPNPKIPSPAAPKRDSPKAEGESEIRSPTALSEESERQSEEETPLVTSLMKSDRTKASKSDRIAGYAITPPISIIVDIYNSLTLLLNVDRQLSNYCQFIAQNYCQFNCTRSRVAALTVGDHGLQRERSLYCSCSASSM